MVAPRKQPPKETWAGAVKAIGIRALSTGKFWQFCFLCVLVAFAFNIESPDWVKIVELFLNSHVYAGLGWFLWVATIIMAVAFHRVQRQRYVAEIDRLVEHRNSLQKEIAGPHFNSSNHKAKK